LFFIFRNLTIQLKLTRLYDNFIANITHGVKVAPFFNPLYLETLSIKEVSPEKRTEFLGIMMKDANRLKKLIDSILEISRLEQKRIAHNYHIYNADSIFRQLIQLLSNNSG